MNKRTYVGSAHHLAYSSMVLGALPMMNVMLSSADWSIGGLRTNQIIFLLILSGICLSYFHTILKTMSQDCSRYHHPQPPQPLLMTALLISMFITGILDLLWLVVISIRVDSLEPQPMPFEDYAIFMVLSASMLCGFYALYKMYKLNRLYRRSQGNV